MLLTERTIIKPSDPRFGQLDALLFLSKNLYNATLYDIRQHFFTTGEYKTYPTQFKEFTKSNNPDYRALPTKISKQTMRVVHSGFKSFFTLLRKKRGGQYDKTVRIPHYLPKGGRFPLNVDKESISRQPVTQKGDVREFIISKKDLNLSFYTKQEYPRHVRFIPVGNHIVQEVIYDQPETPTLTDNGRVASIDLGVNNLFALYTNTGDSLLYNGRPLKSINQHYNKLRAQYQHALGGENRTSKRIRTLTRKRNNRMKTALHTASRQLINHLVTNRIHTLIIGYNTGWKQEISLGKRNNQNFVNIPFLQLVQMIEYKAKLAGITTIRTEESYTSKTSFLDKETPNKHSTYAGKRVKRGLFRTANGTTLNADINGAAQIMRKVTPDAVTYTAEGIRGCRNPRFIKSKNTNPFYTS